MDLTRVFLTLVVSLLTESSLSLCVGKNQIPINLQSLYREESKCSGGNHLKIHINPQCKVSNGLCKPKCDGPSRKDPNTKFTIMKVGGKKCIQFTEQGGTRYALKIMNGTNVAFERRQCDSTASKEFLFDEDKAGRKYRIYKHTANSKTVCLGVTSNCNDKTLSLISTNGQDRRCYFVKRQHC